MPEALKLLDKFVIPKQSARAFEVRKSQILRVIAIEGPQVADLNAFNLHDLREHFSASRTRSAYGEDRAVGGPTGGDRPLIAMSACPSDKVTNNYVPKAIGVEILEPENK